MFFTMGAVVQKCHCSLHEEAALEQRTEVTFTQQDWNVYAECYDKLLALTPYQELRTEVVAHLAPAPGDRILEAGCGTGNVLEALRRACDETALHGIDLSESMLARAWSKLGALKHVTLSKANLNERFPILDGVFNKAVCVNVLYAVAEPLHVLSELHRVLAADGTLVLVTPRAGYDNGLILKAHAESTRPDTYWCNAHLSPEREETLIREAVKDESVIQAMLTVARHNRFIACNATFHFFCQETLLALMQKVGFSIVRSGYGYADQALFVVATKGGV